MELKEKIIYYFKEVVKIPRESGDEKAISDYLVEFAQEHGYKVAQDDLYNVIIEVPSTIPDYAGPSVVLQGHMDMVYVKEPDSPHIYEKGIDCTIDVDRIYSTQKTSLGADNGVALAYFLTIMDSKEISHPSLEIIVTTQEEVGLIGAQYLDCSSIKSKYFINLDSESEGEFFTSCAGGVRNYFTVPMGEKYSQGLIPLTVKLQGLKGGHSGTDINLGRGNAIKLLGRVLKEANSDDVMLSSFKAEGKANSISTAAMAIVGVTPSRLSEFKAKIIETANIIKDELQYTDTPDLIIEENKDEKAYKYYDNDSKNKLLNALELLPFGVVSKSFAIKDLTETSVNIGSAEENNGEIKFLSSVRSCVASRKYELLGRIYTIARVLGCKSEAFNDYPQWNYNPNSPLRELALKTYEDMFHRKATTASIHGGLECGYFDSKIKDVDIISIGCNLYDVHTPKEQVSIHSLYNVWDMLLEILKRLAS